MFALILHRSYRAAVVREPHTSVQQIIAGLREKVRTESDIAHKHQADEARIARRLARHRHRDHRHASA